MGVRVGIVVEPARQRKGPQMIKIDQTYLLLTIKHGGYDNFCFSYRELLRMPDYGVEHKRTNWGLVVFICFFYPQGLWVYSLVFMTCLFVVFNIRKCVCIKDIEQSECFFSGVSDVMFCSTRNVNRFTFSDLCFL